jgi:DNA (cytosine-5)-methyltransferase 1
MTEIIYEADYPSGGERTGIMSIGGVARTLSATDYKQPPSIVLPVLTPEREEKRQNGRRFKDNNEDMFTLTAQDRYGVAIEVKEATKKGYAVAHEGDSINLSMPDSKTRRGRIGGGGGSNTGHKLQSGCNRDDQGEYP